MAVANTNNILVVSLAMQKKPYYYDTVLQESLANHPWFAELEPSKLVLTINNLLADLLICQNFFRQVPEGN